jgi:hypothetical protein
MELNKIELKKVMIEYNGFANRLLRADIDDYVETLKKFLSFVENQSLIREYILVCGEPTFDVQAEVQGVIEEGYAIFEIGDSTKNETANIYHILRYVLDKNIRIRNLIMGYARGTQKYQDMLKGFNDRFVVILIHNIETYLTKIGIDMGMDENVKYNITNTGGQIIVASGNASVTATLNSGIDADKLSALLTAIMNSTSDEHLDEVKEYLDIIGSELKQSKPKKNFIRTAFSGLQAIKGSTEFLAAITTLSDFVQNYIS